jgi:hypothetical protein
MRSTIAQRPSAARLLAMGLLVLLPMTARAQSSGLRSASSDDAFARGAWTLELGAHGALETWNYNGSHEEMHSIYPGITYGLGKGVTVKVGAPLYYVWQRGTDGYLLGLTFGVRSRALRRPRWSLFWEFEVGLSEADTFVPPRGTRFNYLALGGGGIAWRLRPGLHALGGLRWIHVSNNGLAGASRNPDIEAVGPTVGVLIGF